MEEFVVSDLCESKDIESVALLDGDGFVKAIKPNQEKNNHLTAHSNPAVCAPLSLRRRLAPRAATRLHMVALACSLRDCSGGASTRAGAAAR